MPPTLANGKICYIEIPATDIARSSEFYRRVFGWSIRKRAGGSTAFDDTTGEVSGTWVLGRSPTPEPGLLCSEGGCNFEVRPPIPSLATRR